MAKRIIPKRRKNNKAVWLIRGKKILKNMPILMLFVTIIIIFYIVINLDFIQTKATIINQHKNIDNNKILKSINPLLQKKNLDLPQIKTVIIAHPWVKNVKIKRLWNSLTLEIVPQKIQYNWHNLANNKQAYINSSGELFTPNNIIYNHKTTIVSSKNNIKVAFSNLEKYQKILKVKIIKFIQHNIETIILKNGAKIILGLRLQQTRLKKFQKYYALFKIRKNSIIDLRYDHGFAKTN